MFVSRKPIHNDDVLIDKCSHILFTAYCVQVVL